MSRVVAHDFGKRCCVHLEAECHHTEQTIPSLFPVDITAEGRSSNHPHVPIRLRTERRSRVGGRRGTIASPFSTSPLRTRRDRFRVTSLSSGHACHPKAASDIQCHSGSPHFAYRMAPARLTTCAPFPCGWLSHQPW